MSELQTKFASVRKPGRRKKKAPSLQAFHDAALVSPTIRHIASHFGVDVKTLSRWRSENPEIDIMITRVKALDIQEMLSKLRQLGLSGNVNAIVKYLEKMHADVFAAGQPELTLNQNIKVLPTPQTDYRKPGFMVDQASDTDDDGDSIPLFKNHKPQAAMQRTVGAKRP